MVKELEFLEEQKIRPSLIRALEEFLAAPILWIRQWRTG